MNQYKPIDGGEEYLEKYWEGKSNMFVRYWVYLRKGIGLFNESKNYILLAFGSYWTVKTSDIWLGTGVSDSWLILGLVVAIPVGMLILLVLGHWDLYRASKPQEYINNQHGSVTGYNGYNMTIQQVALLEEIKDLLKDLKNETRIQF